MSLVCLVGVPVGSAAATQPPTESQPVVETAAGPSGPIRVLTLVTGDKVTMRGNALGRIAPGQGREDVQFSVFTLSSDLYVVPSDASQLLAADRLDERLFNVSQQLEWGYDDAREDRVPLLAERTSRQSRTRDATVVRSLPRMEMDVLRVDKQEAASFWDRLTASGSRSLRSTVGRLWLDGQVQASLDESVARIGAPAAWRRGLTGKGAKVAVLDSGYDKRHPDLRNAVVQARGFTPAGPGAVRDRLGHGTHVASTIAGSGAASNGRYKGVAPGADLAVGKVLDNTGSGHDSWLIAGMEWAATRARADVVNLSLGGDDLQGVDPLERAISRLTRTTGTLFVVAAGNSGPESRTVNSPASARAALAVGAVDGRDQLAPFSSRGPRVGDHAVKPELTAPGVGITAAVPTQGGARYARLSGTSMATPHVAGAAAIVAQQHPAWKARRLRAALIGSAHRSPGSDEFGQGAGRLSVSRAVRQKVVVATPNLSTYLRYPNRPVNRTLKFVNTSKRRVALDLSAPTEPFQLDRKRISVPAHGTASVRVTVDPDAVNPGAYSDTLIARSGKTVVRTLLGAYIEPPAYNLTVDAVDPQDRRIDGLLAIHSQTGDFWEWAYVKNGHLAHRLRLPADDYNINGMLYTEAHSTLVHEPVDLRGDDTNVVLDLGRAKPATMSLDVDTDDAVSRLVGVQYHRGDTSYVVGQFGVCFLEPCNLTWVLPVRQRGLTYVHFQRLREEGGRSLYHVVDRREGGIPRDPSYEVRSRDLAEVATTYRATVTSGIAERYSGGTLTLPGEDLPLYVLEWTPNRVRLPATVSDYFTSDPDIRWWRGLATDGNRNYLDGVARSYSPGPAHREIWNAAVLGPALTRWCGPGRNGWCGVRKGDTITWSGWSNLSADAGARGRWSDGTSSGTATLRRGGKVIERVPLGRDLKAKVSPGCATYTLVVAGSRPWAKLSTKIRAVHTFRSCHTDEPTPLSLTAVRYAPTGLDELNRAPAGRTTRIPMWIETYADAPVRSLAVQASYNGARTWHDLEVERDGHDWVTWVTNPGSGFVSLRATSVDAHGNTVKQVLTRAYAVARS